MADDVEQCDFCDRPAVYQRFQKDYGGSQQGIYDRYLYCDQCGWVGLELIQTQETCTDDGASQEGTAQDPED